MMMLVAEVADLGPMLDAFWRGSLGSSSAFFSGTLVRAIPLAILGVAVSIAFRAGVFNIGGEGQLLLGAVAAAIVALHLPAPGGLTVVVALAASAAAGALWAGIAAGLRLRFGVLEVISTIMLNFVALNLVSYLVRGPMQEPTHVYPQTASFGPGAQLPTLWATTRLHAGILVAIGTAIAAWWFVARTAAGFRLRAAGASPTAAAVAGRIDVPRVSSRAFLLSGALAGLAGGVEVSGVTYALYENLSPGYGFSAIAVALLARLHPGWVLLSAFLFATLETGALGMQRDASVPSVVATAVEALVILVLVGASGVLGTVPASWRSRLRPIRAETS
jgi:general nucleoside transport system permease protein